MALRMFKTRRPGRGSSLSDQVGQGHGPDDVLDAVLVLLRFGGDRLQVVLIVHGEHAAEGISTEMLDEGPCDPVAVFEQQPFELDGILERAAVGHHAGGVNHWVLADPLRHDLPRPPLSDGVVVVPGDSKVVDLRVAGGAARVVAVGFDLLANGRFRAFGRVRFNRVDVGRGRRRRFAEDRFDDPPA